MYKSGQESSLQHLVKSCIVLLFSLTFCCSISPLLECVSQQTETEKNMRNLCKLITFFYYILFQQQGEHSVHWKLLVVRCRDTTAILIIQSSLQSQICSVFRNEHDFFSAFLSSKLQCMVQEQQPPLVAGEEKNHRILFSISSELLFRSLNQSLRKTGSGIRATNTQIGVFKFFQEYPTLKSKVLPF